MPWIHTIGLPLLYVGGLTVPLGFARSGETRNNQKYDYGYKYSRVYNTARPY